MTVKRASATEWKSVSEALATYLPGSDRTGHRLRTPGVTVSGLADRPTPCGQYETEQQATVDAAYAH